MNLCGYTIKLHGIYTNFIGFFVLLRFKIDFYMLLLNILSLKKLWQGVQFLCKLYKIYEYLNYCTSRILGGKIWRTRE